MNKQDALTFIELLQKLREEVAENTSNSDNFWDSTIEATIANCLIASNGDLLNDKDVVLALLKKFPDAEYSVAYKIPDACKANRDVALAIATGASTWPLVTEPFKDDTDFMRKVVACSPSYLASASERIQHDRETVLIAVRDGKLSLSRVSDEFLTDAEIVHAAISNNPLDMQYADKAFQKNPDEVLDGLRILREKSSRYYFEDNLVSYFKYCVSRTFRNNRDFMLKAIEIAPVAYEYAFAKLREESGDISTIDQSLLYAYVKAGGDNIQSKEDAIPKNPKFGLLLAKAATKENLDELACWMPDEVRDDKEYALYIVKHDDGYGLARVSERMCDNEEVVRAAIKKRSDNIRYASERLQEKYSAAIAADVKGEE